MISKNTEGEAYIEGTDVRVWQIAKVIRESTGHGLEHITKTVIETFPCLTPQDVDDAFIYAYLCFYDEIEPKLKQEEERND